MRTDNKTSVSQNTKKYKNIKKKLYNYRLVWWNKPFNRDCHISEVLTSIFYDMFKNAPKKLEKKEQNESIYLYRQYIHDKK